MACINLAEPKFILVYSKDVNLQKESICRSEYPTFLSHCSFVLLLVPVSYSRKKHCSATKK